jgi:probable rRNA maturation factor
MIVNLQRRVPISVSSLRKFCERARRELGFPKHSVTINLITDRKIASLNETYRQKRGPTDVLSFPAHGPGENGVQAPKNDEANGYIGDIAISPETARRNARRFSRTLPEEMRILILHGMIHLAGYDHETDHGEMDRLERRLRKRLGVEER